MSSQIVPSPTDQEIQALITAMQQIRTVNNVTISTLAFMLYDIIINLKEEVRLSPCNIETDMNIAQIHWVWKNNQKDGNGLHIPACMKLLQIFVQFLFIFSRFYGLVCLTIMFAGTSSGAQSAANFCLSAGTVLYTPAVNVILAVRLDAMHRVCNGSSTNYRRLLCLLVIGQFLVEFTTCVFMAVRTAADVVSPPPWFPWPGCMSSSQSTPAFTLASWLTALLCSIAIFCAMALKNAFCGQSLVEIRNDMPTLKVVLRDTVAFYFLIFAILLASTVVLMVVQNELSALPMPLLVATYSYCVSRLILNIRGADDPCRLGDGPDNDPDTISMITFMPASDEREA
ncbi:hypothetical protein BU15DRAFT_80980 [Melanogaster broomeanus]|nr:hypothetical protein BU15DRAFT_80980 [Melanogaster broomeanus]